ncbi:ABC transporter transmembrane domain-containing protein [Schlesneria paludicola]|uniref:ABC transporter transmembrane domain-containing protein n=1 Tax=Schlesneria paludicola TaxID=360056 RepID=UPI00029AB9AB|nr:ABC transporter ATP-binding protein [Schlesneria paludicola]
MRGRARIAGCWSILAAIALVLLLGNLNLLMGLLIDRGHIDLSLLPPDIERFERLSGLSVIRATAPADGQVKLTVPANAVPAEEAPPEPIHVYYDEHGILPTVWHNRDFWWGPGIAYLYRQVPWLQSNILALVCLLSSAAGLYLLRDGSLRQMRLSCQRGSIEAVTATRRNLFRQVLRIGPQDLDGSEQSTATYLFTTEVETIRRGLHDVICSTIRYAPELFGLATVLFSLDWRLALQWIAPTTLVLLLVDGVRRKAQQKENLAEDRIRDEEQTLLSRLQNSRLTRGLGIEQTELEQFQKHLDRYHSQLMDAARTADKVAHPQGNVVLICVGLLAFLLFLVGGNVLVVGKLPSSTRMAACDAFTFIFAAFLAIPGMRAFRSLPEIRREVNLVAERIRRYLEQIPSVSQAVGAKFLQPMSKTLHFENVKYQTPAGRLVLDGIDFKIPVDTTTAIVSLDPLEARAVALMLPRFIEPRQGRVLIDGEDIAWGTLESLRAETVFVSANDPPFDGTVLENIRGGQAELTLQQVTEAAKMTHAHNFIVKLFNGYETILTGHGDSLDAGQKFRLNLARAIARGPALLIVEEPTEVLDEDTKTLLVDAYDRICRERTVIFLPARMSTVRRTDQVIVLHEGKVVALGPHSKLVTQSLVYRHWEYLHFNEFRHDGQDEAT